MPEWIFIPAGTYLKIPTDEEIREDLRWNARTGESFRALNQMKEWRQQAEIGDEVASQMVKQYEDLFNRYGRGYEFNSRAFILEEWSRRARRSDRED